MKFIVSAMVLGLGGIIPALAADFPVEISIRCPFDKDKDSLEKGPVGSGVTETSKARFEAQLDNTSFDPQKNIHIKIFVVAANFDWTPSNDDCFILKTLEKKDLEVNGNEKKVVELGEAEFKSEAFGGNGVAWRGGIKYQGWVAEIYSGSDLIKVFDKGGNGARKAYKAFLKGGEKTPNRR
jgi:hypothetical protein